MAQIHHRMPVILGPEDEERWLRKEMSAEAAQALLVPFSAALMTAVRSLDEGELTNLQYAGSDPRPCA